MSGLRYFYLTLFLLLVAVVMLGGYFMRSYLEDRVIRHIVHDSHKASLVDFATEVWEPQRRIFNRLPCAGVNCPDVQPAQIAFDNYFIDKTVLYARIYRNSDAKESLFTQPEFAINHTASDDFAQSFRLAASGSISSNVVENVSFQNQQYTVVRTLYPLIIYADERRETARITGVIEVAYDITPFWGQIGMWQMWIAVAVILLFVVLMVAILISNYQTEKALAKQFEKNTELLEAKAEAEEDNKSKSQFLANISHELRTPLNAIIGFSQIIKDEVMGPINNPEYKQYIRDIYVSGSHLLELINDILDFSKAEADKLTVNIEDVDMRKLINNSIRLVTPRAEEAQVTLSSRVPKEKHVVATDPKRLRQVILNVLSNAVKFTEAGGTVTVQVWHSIDDSLLYIETQDTGVGIAPKDISKVMSVFGQAENKLSRRYEGTGLGLPLSKKLVELMGGELEIESELNVGTKVTIKLPYTTADEATVSTPQVEANTAVIDDKEAGF